jgi:Plasmid pRiA4b ORF-3-like protein
VVTSGSGLAQNELPQFAWSIPFGRAFRPVAVAGWPTMTRSDVGEHGTRAGEDLARQATAPARWLLETAADGGVPLTQTLALARAVVREVAERWPAWWDADLFGPPHREADMALLEELHEGLRRLRLVRRRGRKLYATVEGAKLAADPVALLRTLASDLGGGDPFSEMVAEEMVGRLTASPPCTHEQLVAPALRSSLRGGWADPAGVRPGEEDLSWAVGDVLCRGEAYGLIERRMARDDMPRWPSLISLSHAGSLVYGSVHPDAARGTVFVFDARLVDVPGDGARVTVAANEDLSALHMAIQLAFGWADDHLYSFWIDGRFWTEVPIDELDLQVGAKITYVVDYGEQSRVMLTLLERREMSARE